MNINAKGQVVRQDMSGELVNAIVLPQWEKTSNGGTKWLVQCKLCPEKREWWAWGEVIKRIPELRCPECRKAVIAAARTTHGMRYTAFYQCWTNIHGRCYNVNHKAYKDYGERGIIVCLRWHTFESFRDDMHASYLVALDKYNGVSTIDRTDVNGNYEPSNCIWNDREGQANNRRTNKTLVAFGKTLTFSQWARALDLDKTTIRKRWLKGWPAEQCLSKEDFRK